MRAARFGLVLLALAGCEGLIVGERPTTAEAPAGPACGGEQFCVGKSGLARLSALEYQQTVVAAFGALAAGERFEGLPGDGRAGPFWSNEASPVTDDSVAQYRLVAEHVAATIAGTSTAALQCPGAVDDACIDAFIARSARQLFRAAPTSEELAVYGALFRLTQTRSGAVDATRVTLTAMLQAPRFLYQLQPGAPVAASVAPGEGEVVQLGGAALANRLSYFLWGTPPDDALLAEAARGELDTREGVERAARRLLLDGRADRRLGQFHSQWLELEELPFRTFPAAQPAGFDALRTGLFAEPQAFGARVIRQDDAKLATLLTASWSVVTGDVGAFYGVGGLPAEASRVVLPAGERAGLLTQAGFLATHLHDASTQAVHRGKAIRELLLCQTIPPPPANIDPRVVATPSLSPRQRLEQKTSDASCAGCHQLMNPAGFTLEGFDVWGRHRTIVDDAAAGLQFPVDAHGELSNVDIAGPVNGHVELGQALAGSEVVHRCVARQWFRFAVGRLERKEDEGALAQTWERYQGSGRDLRELIVAIAGSDAFRFRRY